jgi:hypothetical protein
LKQLVAKFELFSVPLRYKTLKVKENQRSYVANDA